MTCPHCTRSAQELWHGFSDGCRGCQARMLSRSPSYYPGCKGDLPYESFARAMEITFLTADELQHAHQTDFMNRANK